VGAPCTTAIPEALDEFARYLADEATTGAGLLLVVAHPDDEAVGFGGQLGRLRQTSVICLTDGAPADLRDARAHGFASAAEYAAARRAELEAALAEITFPLGNFSSLDISDQQAARHLVPLAQRLAIEMGRRQPRFVLTHPYEGGHPDHDAAAFAVAGACALLRRQGTAVPAIVEMACYHAGATGTEFQRFVPDATCEVEVRLPPPAVSAKRRMLACHATQRETLAAFDVSMERFRLAPSYDFRTLPNGGRLQYEAWQLGLTGAEWLRLAAAALDGLELAP
jgi:LmbE family N-acetylglucosaminyl deacetylase